MDIATPGSVTDGRAIDFAPVRILAAFAFVFAVPFVLFYRLILSHFYTTGSFLLDSGLLAALMYHNPALAVPESLNGGSFFASHVAPILVVVSAVSEWLPVSMPAMFAGFVGVCHGLLGVGMLWLLVSGFGMRRSGGLLLSALASCGFAFNGLAIDIARYPHFETFGAACLLLFFVAVVLEHWPAAVASFVLAIATREDVGLHAFGFLSVWIALNLWRGVPWRGSVRLAWFAAVGLGYAVAVILAQHVAFPGTSSFMRVYVGDPPFRHLTAELLLTRLAGWGWLHSCIILPALVALVWSVRARNPYMMIGYVACVPWALLQLCAASDLAGWMVGYYAYPFLIAMAWPWIGLLIRARQEGAGPVWRMPEAARVLGMVALSLLPIGQSYDPGHIALPRAFLGGATAAQRAATDRAVAAIVAARPGLGRLVVDNSVAALRPFDFPRSEVAGWAPEPADTVVFMAQGFDAERLRAVARGLPVVYRVGGSGVWIATDRAADVLAGLGLSGG
jgi:hypothetical protein